MSRGAGGADFCEKGGKVIRNGDMAQAKFLHGDDRDLHCENAQARREERSLIPRRAQDTLCAGRQVLAGTRMPVVLTLSLAASA